MECEGTKHNFSFSKIILHAIVSFQKMSLSGVPIGSFALIFLKDRLSIYIFSITKVHHETMIQASKEAIEGFVDDVQSLWLQSLCSSIPVLEQPPTAMEFFRDFVAVNRPCLIRNLPHASSLLTLDALVSRHADLEIAVDITPDGYGDCLRCVRLSPGATAGEDVLCFVQPCQCTMSLLNFQQKLRQQAQRKGNVTTDSIDYRSRSFETLLNTPTDEDTNLLRPEYEPDGIVYYSRQNDCLRTELAVLWEDELLQDVPRSFDWAAPALGTLTAINLWIGNECTTSAMHKDYYENLYYVATGEKIITLCPPSDIAFVYEQEYRSGSFAYCTNKNAWKVRLDHDQKVRWMGADVTL